MFFRPFGLYCSACFDSVVGFGRINVLDKKKTGAQNIVKEIKQYQEKVATTCTEDGHKQTTKTSTTI